MYDNLISTVDLEKLTALNNQKVMDVVDDAIKLMKPEKVIVLTDNFEEIENFRNLTLNAKEEKKLAIIGHTIHYDGYYDQARDKGHTATLLPEGQQLSRGLNVVERESGLKEILSIMDGAMQGKTMIIRFFCLGPTNSRFSISALQITDSFYVAHSEDILYRPGYEQFKILNNKDDFFYFWQSAGRLDERNTTIDIDKRRIYIDPAENRVLSVNNQYAGNSLACKKLALRLAIYKANHSDWLTEHMFISAYYSPYKDRKTYFAGAFPSACGKTSTAMIPGATIVGDDIAYIKEGSEGEMRAVNIEQGIFGIIKDVNEKDDPEIFKAITTPKEIIFSNVLTTTNGKAYWQGMGKNFDIPNEGFNHAGKWKEGNKDKDGNIIPISHPNARFTVGISVLDNVDEALHASEGVQIDAVLYGGRDSDTTVPVAESLDWVHGVFIGATIESETTSATLGKAGVRKSNPMACMDFIIVPLSKYFKNHLKFGRKLKKCPKVFSTNYFLKGENGQYLNTKLDKKVWVLWAEGRVHGDYDAILTPIGHIPKYEDLKNLFSKVFEERVYTKEEYIDQFSLHIHRYLEKYERMEELFKDEPDMPIEFKDELTRIRNGLENLQNQKGKNIISPFEL